MESDITYNVIAYCYTYVGRVMAFDVYKSIRKVAETNSYLKLILCHEPFAIIRIPFTETIEKDKTYYYNKYGGTERAIITNRTTPMEAIRDAFNCIAKKQQDTFEPHYMSMAMGKIISTLRRMFQEDGISNVNFAIRQDQAYVLMYQNKEGKVVTVHNGFII